MPYRRIYIDSRFAISGGTASKFDYSLPGGSIELPADTACVVDQIQIPNVFPCIRAGINDKLYWKEQLSGQSVVEKVATLDAGNYNANSLATEIARVMNTNTVFAAGSAGGVTTPPYAVSYSTSDAVMQITNQVVYNSASPPVQQNVGSVFRIMTRAEMEALSTWNSAAITKDTLYDCCEQIGRVAGTSSDVTVGNQLKFSEHVDVLPVKSVFLCSPNLGYRSCLGCRGETDILARIPITVGFGQYEYVTAQTGFDHWDASHSQLSTLSFELRDTAGRQLNMKGRHISFSLLFIDKSIF